MPEEEITKHSRKVIKVIRERGNFKHKIKEIMVEIATIVFAITLSLIVERWREHSAEQKLEHNFLTNLVTDLKEDEKQLKDDSLAYANMKNAFGYFRQAYSGIHLQPEKALPMSDYLYNIIGFVPSNSRYEALKGSGKLDVIEDKELQLDIVNLYQQTIPNLLASTDWFSTYKNKLAEYADQSLVIKGKQNNIQQLMERPATYNMLNKDPYIDNIIYKYHLALVQTRKIVEEIDARGND